MKGVFAVRNQASIEATDSVVMDFCGASSVAGFCQLTDKYIPHSDEKATGSRVTTVITRSTRPSICSFSKGYISNSHLVSQADSD